MVVRADGSTTGAVSGGCLEADIVARAAEVLAAGTAELVRYDTRSDDGVLGLGMGCQGVINVRLEPLAGDALRAEIDRLAELRARNAVRLLVCGAGADAIPVVRLAAMTGWLVTVVDHRPSFATSERFPDAERREVPVTDDNPMYVRDYSKCLLCWRCVQVCADDAQYTYAINFEGRGYETQIGTFFDRSIPETTCVLCGQCVGVCPTGALKPKREFLLEQGMSPNESSVLNTVR
jgi:xanthine/CO dehydrogenase XdhC/CoxF family maturation factor